MDNKALRNVIRELSKVVPSSHLVSSGFLMDTGNLPYIGHIRLTTQKKRNQDRYAVNSIGNYSARKSCYDS